MTRAEKARQTRQQLLAVAIRLFAERGFDGTSLQMIADEMGMTKAAVYYHFRAKTDILRALAELMIEQVTGLLDVVATKRSRRDRIETFATGYVDDILIGQRTIVAVVSDDPAVHVRMAVEQDRFTDLRQQLVHALYGEAPTDDERTAVYAVEGLAKAVPYLNDLDDDALRSTLWRTCVRILTVRS
jgi:AcrR family transcriptional regulator